MGDTLITSDYKITLNTKLRNPEDVRYNDTDSTQNYFKTAPVSVRQFMIQTETLLQRIAVRL